MADLATTEATIKIALQSNRRLQSEVLRQIQRLAKKKAENRNLASRISEQLASTWESIDELQTPAPPLDPSREILDELIANEKKSPEQTTTTSNVDEKEQTTLLIRQQSKAISVARRRIAKKWRCDPYRKWTRRFFVDPDGEIPRSNDDVEKRRLLEQGKTFHHTYSAWSTNEVEILRSIVVEQMNQGSVGNINTTSLNNGVTLGSIDFEQVAGLLNERMGTATGSPKSRSAAECSTKYLNNCGNSSAFSKEESLRLLKLVHLQQNPSWGEVALALGTNRTPWQCMSSYQTKLSRGQPTIWTPAQDELILKYAAAMGPQWDFGGGPAAQMASRLLPDKDPKQILTRAHTSLVNPNFVRDIWSDEEDRKLVLCMKIYRDETSAAIKAASQLPGRSTKSVSEKWNRSLNPDISQQPFSEEEDRTLLDAVKQFGDLNFTRISREKLPDRHRRTLQDRWAELASEEDILKMYGSSRRRKEGVRSSESALLCPDDFVVRIKYDSTSGEIP